jgi:hypothetical protein
MPPMSVIATDSTVAKIGRSMKNREITADLVHDKTDSSQRHRDTEKAGSSIHS